MPFTDSGLWVPRTPEEEKSSRKLSASIVLSGLSFVVSIGVLLNTRYQTQVAQRAYLSAEFDVINEDVLYKQLAAFADGEAYLGFKTDVKNLGNTPAESVAVTLEQTQPFLGLTSHSMPVLPIRDIGPKSDSTFQGNQLFEYDPKRPPKDFHAQLIEHVDYNDAFGTRHRDNFCFEVSANADSVHVQRCTLSQSAFDRFVEEEPWMRRIFLKLARWLNVI